MNMQKVSKNKEPFSRKLVLLALLVAGLIALNRFFFAVVWKPLFLKLGPDFCNSVRTTWLSCTVTNDTVRIGRDAIGACFGAQTLGFNGILFLFFLLGTFFIFSSSFRNSKLLPGGLAIGVPLVFLITIFRFIALTLLFRALQNERFRNTYSKEAQIFLTQSGWVIYGLVFLFFVVWLRNSILNRVEKLKLPIGVESSTFLFLLIFFLTTVSNSAFANCKVCGNGTYLTGGGVFYTDSNCMVLAVGCFDTTYFSACTTINATNATHGCNGCGGISFDASGSFAGCHGNSTTCATACGGASEFPTALTPLMMFLTFAGVYYAMGWYRKRRTVVR